MKAGPKARARLRTGSLIAACAVAGAVAVAVAGPGLATAAEKLAQDVFVTNTANNPVRVAPQGTTQVAGTVTVANQPEPPAPPALPRPIQIRIPSSPVTHDHPTSTERLFTVPQGKVLPDLRDTFGTPLQFRGCFLAPPPGLEPGTCGLEVRCSIQLSYGGV
jgi:hypothetical protein